MRAPREKPGFGDEWGIFRQRCPAKKLFFDLYGGIDKRLNPDLILYAVHLYITSKLEQLIQKDATVWGL